jgi:hypothetical protein
MSSPTDGSAIDERFLYDLYAVVVHRGTFQVWHLLGLGCGLVRWLPGSM